MRLIFLLFGTFCTFELKWEAVESPVLFLVAVLVGGRIQDLTCILFEDVDIV